MLFSPSFLIWGVCLLVQFRTYSQKFRVKFGADITPSTYWNFHSHEWLRMPNIQKQPLTGCHFGKQCCSFVLFSFSFSFWKTGVVWKIYASRIWKVNIGLKNVFFTLECLLKIYCSSLLICEALKWFTWQSIEFNSFVRRHVLKLA